MEAQRAIHTSEDNARIAEGVRRRWAAVRHLDFVAASVAFRSLVREGSDNRDLLAALAQRAFDLAPEGAHRETFRRYRDAITSGRRVKIASYPVRTVEPPDPELVNEVEDALRGVIA
ncbi:MAG: hypothetical protein WD556_09530 [Actinomycetota bacterium]